MIKVQKADLLYHLRQIAIKGMVSDCILERDLSCHAYSSKIAFSHTLGDVEGELSEPVGVLDLKRLITAVSELGDVLTLDYAGSRLRLVSGDISVSLRTAHPNNIGFKANDGQREALVSNLAQVYTGGVALGEDAYGSLAAVLKISDSDSTILRVVDGKVWVSVGRDSEDSPEDSATVSLGDSFKSTSSPGSFQDMFNTSKMKAVIQAVGEQGMVYYTAKGQALVARTHDERYSYFLGPYA